MSHPEGQQPVKVGVLLARRPDDLGEWLAEGASFEAAGADALWVALAPERELDPLAVTAALAAVTFRSLLVTALPAGDGPSRDRARTLGTIGRLSHGRLRILTDAPTSGDLAEAGPGLEVFRRVPGDPETFALTRGPDEAERWVTSPCPDGRATWRAALLDAAGRGFRGLLVPAEPRLLDILRNPGEPDHRGDLQLAQG